MNVYIDCGVLEYCDAKIDQVPMLKIYLEKAFSKARHDVIFKVLETVGLSEVIQQGFRMA